MKRIGQIFFRGLAVVLPVGALVYCVYSFYHWAEKLMNVYLLQVFPAINYTPGMGIAFGVLVIFVVGLVMGNIISRSLLSFFESVLERVPVVSSIYSAIKDLMSFFQASEKGAKNKVVSVKWPGQPIEMIGFVTNENLKEVLPDIDGELKLAVYFPMSYQVGGYTLFIPSEWVKEIDMSVEKAMRSTLTAWVKK